MKLTEVYRHFIQIECNDGIVKSYEYYSTEFMSNTEFQDMLVEIKIDCPDFKIIQYLAERRVL